MFKDISKLMKQAQQIQQDMARAQEELAQMRVTGEAGGGIVKITLTGGYELVEVKVAPEMIADSLELLEELIAAALQDALEKVKAAREEKLGGLKALGPSLGF